MRVYGNATMTRIALTLALVALVGCKPASAPPPPPAPTLTWTGNGNPGVPECGPAVTVWCVTGYRLTDSKGLSVPLPLTQTRYTPPDVASYQLVVTGVDGTGRTVVSLPATVP